MTSASGPPPPDLLVSGDERPHRSWSPGQRRLAAGVAATVAVAVAAGALVSAERARDERRRVTAVEQDVVRLSLLAPGQDGGPRYGPRPPGIHVVLGNAGPATVRLLEGTLTPGAWQVQVPPGRELRPGRSVALELTPPRDCGTSEPRVLRVEALPPSGRPSTVAFDLGPARLAYGGTLADAVAAAALHCHPIALADDGRT